MSLLDFVDLAGKADIAAGLVLAYILAVFRIKSLSTQVIYL